MGLEVLVLDVNDSRGSLDTRVTSNSAGPELVRGVGADKVWKIEEPSPKVLPEIQIKVPSERQLYIRGTSTLAYSDLGNHGLGTDV